MLFDNVFTLHFVTFVTSPFVTYVALSCFALHPLTSGRFFCYVMLHLRYFSLPDVTFH